MEWKDFAPGWPIALSALFVLVGHWVNTRTKPREVRQQADESLRDDQRELIKELRGELKEQAQKIADLQTANNNSILEKAEWINDRARLEARIEVLGGSLDTLQQQVQQLQSVEHKWVACQEELDRERERAACLNIECEAALKAQERAEGGMMDALKTKKELEARVETLVREKSDLERRVNYNED